MKRRGFLGSIVGLFTLPACLREADIKLIRPEKGDVVVVKFDRLLTEDALTRASKCVRKIFPDCKTVILEQRVSMDIYRIEHTVR